MRATRSELLIRLYRNERDATLMLSCVIRHRGGFRFVVLWFCVFGKFNTKESQLELDRILLVVVVPLII